MYNDAMKNYMMRLANGGMYSYQGSMNPPQVLVDSTGSVVPPSNMLDGGMMGNAQVRRSGLRPSGMFAGDFMNSQFMAAQADYMQGGTHMYQGKPIKSCKDACSNIDNKESSETSVPVLAAPNFVS